MKRVLLVIACVSLPLALTGCDVLNYIWQHIVGHSYSQVDLTTLESSAGSMSAANIQQSVMPINSVLGYRTRSNLYGKLKVLSISSSGLTVQFYTYDALGGEKASSSSLTVPASHYCDLETGSEAAALGAASDFQWSGGTLYPTSPAVIYVFP